MPRYADDWDEEPDDDWGEDDDFDSSEDDADADDTVPCPYCREPIPEDAPRCPYCEQYISREDAPPARKPWWLILGALAGLLVVYFWITAGL
jgi:hypothetical protein